MVFMDTAVIVIGSFASKPLVFFEGRSPVVFSSTSSPSTIRSGS